MIVAIISFVLCIVGVSFSSTDYNGFKKKVEFCNDHPSQVRLFLRVKYQEVEYAMFVDIISAHRCEKLDAVVNGKYLLRSSTFDRTSFMSTVTVVQQQSLYRFGGYEPLSAIRNEASEVSSPVKRPLTSPSEKENNIRVKIVPFVPVANIFQETVDESTGKRTREHITTTYHGEETYVNALNGTILVATDELVSSSPRKVYSGFRVEYSNIRTWFVVDSDNLDEKTMKAVSVQAKHLQEYFNETGIHWIHHVGPHGRRSPIRHHMWTASHIGQKFAVSSVSSPWNCDPVSSECQKAHLSSQTFELEAISLRPKIFLVQHFLSAFECDHLRKLAEPLLTESLIAPTKTTRVADYKIRSSSTAWLNRKSSPILNSIYRRAADVLQIDDSEMHPFVSTEDLQVVKYDSGGYYRNHLDWGEHVQGASRYVSFLIYLNNQSHPNAGGETVFPLADEGEGFKIHPGEGSVVFFYNLLEDGNGDELTIHTALPVLEGEKWVANLWIWDPVRREK